MTSMIAYLVSALIIASLPALSGGQEASSDPEERLAKFLKTASDASVRPGLIENGVKGPVNVNLTFTPFRILGLDGQLETFSVLAYLTEEWEDARLVWKPEDYGGLESISLNKDAIWTPKTYLPNLFVLNRDDKAEIIRVQVELDQQENDDQPPVVRVTLETHVLLQDRCDFNMSYYPFDRQSCEICMSSTFYKKKDLTYEVDYNIRSFMKGGEWSLDDGYPYPQEDGVASLACVELVVTRKYGYYLVNLFIPTVCICLLNTIGLFASLDADQAVLDFAGMGQTTLLSLGVLLLTVADQTPKGTGTVSLLETFFLIMIFQTLLAAINAVYLRKSLRSASESRISTSGTLKLKDTSRLGNLIRFCMITHVLIILITTVVIIGIGCVHSHFGD